MTTFFFNDTKTVPSIRFYRDKLSTQTLLFRKGEGLIFFNLIFGRDPTTGSEYTGGGVYNPPQIWPLRH